ncbi:MAG: tetratricopeptide repeat protein [Oceanospirillales bacterium]|nr:tetratricopeptide repeat protein [Oceanospirillales bacterium]
MSLPSLSEALSLMNQGAWSAARAICTQHLAHRPDDFNARHLLGLILFKSGNLLVATKELNKAVQQTRQPRFKAQALNNLALVLQARGKLEQALEACHKAVELQPDEAAFHLNLLSLMEQQQQWQAIIAHLQHTPQLAIQDDAQLFHAVALRHLGRYQDALDMLHVSDESIEGLHEYALNQCLLGHSDTVIATWQQSGAGAGQLIACADYIAEEGYPQAATPLYKIAAHADPENLSLRHLLDAANGTCTTAAPPSYVRSLYDTHADQFEHRLQDRLAYQAPQQLCQHLATLLGGTHIDAVDLGCGTGLCGIELRKQLSVRRLSGCDLSEQMLRLAADKQVYDELACRSLTDYLSDMTAVDLITATDVLIYTGNLDPILAQMPNVLNSGGLFAFTVEHTTDDNDVSLHSSGRYRHSRSHIETLAERYRLQIRLLEAFPLRLENDEPITGLMVILQQN